VVRLTVYVISVAGIESNAISQVSGVKLVLNWIVYRRIGARLSPNGSQLIDASRLLQLTLLSFGAFGTSTKNKNAISFLSPIFKYFYTKLLCLEKNVTSCFGAVICDHLMQRHNYIGKNIHKTMYSGVCQNECNWF
jgi:uncharacterized membrane protein